MVHFNEARRIAALLGSTALFTTLLTGLAQADRQIIAPDILVSAPAGPAPIEQVGSSVSVITADDIERRQYRTVGEALQGVPGLHIVQSGSKGSVTSVFSRGGNSNHTLVLLNGIEINDPGAPAGAFDFSTLTTENVERIEVIRGPQSGLYGSAALGGVINIITKKGEGALRTSVRAELGSLGTFNTAALADGSYAGIGYALSLSRQATDGSDITPQHLRGGFAEEEDGNENTALSLQLDTDLSDTLSAFTFGQYINSNADTDNSLPQDFNAVAKNQEIFLSGGLKGNFYGGAYRPVLTLAYTDYTRVIIDHPDAANLNTNQESANEGTRSVAKLENFVTLGNHTLNLAGEYKYEELEARGFRDFGFGFVQQLRSEADEYTTSFWLSDRVTFGERFFASASVRYDNPENFGDEVTYTLTPGYYHPETDTRLTASYGTGFKVPSLFERYGFTPNSFGNAFRGNPNLEPEESEGWEVGLEQGFLGGRIQTGLTYFDTDYENAIITVFLPSFDSTTTNVNEFNAHGVESFIDVEISDALSARADYTFTVVDTQPLRGGQSRRPRHKVHGTLDWQAMEDARLGLTVTWVDLYRDVDRVSGGLIEGDNYTVVDLTGSKDIGPHFQVFGRVNNAFDAAYEPADGFEAPGREFLMGVKVTF